MLPPRTNSPLTYTRKAMVPLTEKQVKESQILEALLSGLITNKQATKASDLSIRQVQRKKKAYQKEDAEALIHKNTGRRPSNRISEPIRSQIAQLLTHELKDYSLSHASKILESDFHIRVSRSTLRRIVLEYKITQAQRKKADIFPEPNRKK